MKKISLIVCCSLLLTCICMLSSSAADFEDRFFLTEKYIYLSDEMTVCEMREGLGSFELTSVADRAGNGLDEYDFVPTGASLTLADTNLTDAPLTRTAVLIGDVDCNGKVEVSDARKALRIAVGLEDAEDYYVLLACDTDCTASETISDARGILRVSVGLNPYSTWFKVRSEKFPDDYILVTMNAEYQNAEGLYEPDFFNEETVQSVEMIFNQNETQILKLYLNNPGVDGCELLIRFLAGHPAVKHASKDSYIYGD